MRVIVNGLIIGTFLVIMATVPSCTHSPYVPEDINNGPNDTIPTFSNTCSPDTVYFERDILPILASNCAISGCHDAVTRQEGYNFSSYAGFINTDAVSGGDLNDSELFEVITENDPDKLMPPPPRPSLTAAQIQLFRTWILQGAKNNNCNSGNTTCDTTNITYSGRVQQILQTKCIGCHSAGAPSGGVTLSTYAGLLVVVNDGSLLGALKHQTGFVAMPQGQGMIPACEIAQIEAWVNAGAPNN